eukprot:m.1108011 g.1108011  ORF g.1108011 m.1108011 type:complete len:151 (-) comp24351_c0_seq3:1283-1735(-)
MFTIQYECRRTTSILEQGWEVHPDTPTQTRPLQYGVRHWYSCCLHYTQPSPVSCPVGLRVCVAYVLSSALLATMTLAPFFALVESTDRIPARMFEVMMDLLAPGPKTTCLSVSSWPPKGLSHSATMSCPPTCDIAGDPSETNFFPVASKW